MTKPQRFTAAAATVTAGAVVGWFTYPILTIIVLTLVGGYGWSRWYRRAGSAALVARWSDRAKKHHGVASFWTILRISSWWTLRRRARVLKPSLNGQSWWTRWRLTPIGHLGTRVIKSGRIWVRSTVEEHTLRLGAPRTGKSGNLANVILDAPGAVLATSTGSDLIHNTADLRAKLGPVHVFNPSNVGGIPSTLGFNILGGCEDPRIARERAADLISATPLAEAKKEQEWVGQSTDALGVLMHAAAVGGTTMHRVQRWIADPDSAAEEVIKILRKQSQHPDTITQAWQFFKLGRPQSSVTMGIKPALLWLADPVAAACAGVGAFNVAEFLQQRGTIYLLAEDDSPVAPLVTAFAGYITRTARRIANQQPRERLEPAFTLCLDEAPIICPLPIPKWASDLGKRNITMHVCGQSFSQFQHRFGDKPAGALLTNCATRIVFGGIADDAGLRTFSTLSGGLLTPSQIDQLPQFHALVLRRGLLPIVGRMPMVWQRPDHKAAARAAVWQPRITRLGALCRAPFTRAALRSKPAREPIAALPAGGTADREFAELLQQHGLS